MNSRHKRGAVRARPAPRNAAIKKRPRPRKYKIDLFFSRQLIITPRKTSSRNRRSRQKQLVIPFNKAGLREVGISVKKRRPLRRRRQTLGYFMLVRPRTIATTMLITAGITGAIFFSFNLQKPVNFTVTKNNVSAAAITRPISTKALPRSIPIRIQIPKIGVDSQLTQVGVQQDGRMEMPWDIETAAWYKYSPTPGEIGPSIIVGHLDGAQYANMAGVFYRLHELAPGDQIKVFRQDGSEADFKVIGLEQVSQDNFATKQVYGNIRYAGLRVITCGGTFEPAAGHYSENTVVYGALE